MRPATARSRTSLSFGLPMAGRLVLVRQGVGPGEQIGGEGNALDPEPVGGRAVEGQVVFPLGFLDRRKSNDSLPDRYFRALRAVLTPSDVTSEGDSSAPRRPLACQQGRSLHGRRSASGLPLVAAAAVVHSRRDPRECDVQQPGGRLTDLRSGLACDAHEEFMKVSSHQAVSFGNRPGALLTAPRNGRIR